MSTKIQGGANPHVEHELQQQHTEQAHAHQGQVSHLNMQHTQLRGKIQHAKAQTAAFYRNKRYAATHGKPKSASGQKLMRQLGKRPRPGTANKPRGKDVVRERNDEGRRNREGHREKEPEHDRKQGQHHEHERHAREHNHDQGQQGQKRQGQGQQGGGQGQQGQHNQQGRPNQQRQQEQGGRRDKPASFAVKKAGGAARVAATPTPTALQALAETQRDTPVRQQGQVLALAYARHVTQSMLGPASASNPGSQSELKPEQVHAGHIPPLAMLNNIGPMARRRSLARVRTQMNGALAQHANEPGKRNAVAGVLGATIDMTLARRSCGIDYTDAEQSLSMVRQWLIDATGGSSTPAPNGAGSGAGARTAPSSSATPDAS